MLGYQKMTIFLGPVVPKLQKGQVRTDRGLAGCCGVSSDEASGKKPKKKRPWGSC